MAEKTEFLQAIDDAILDADSLERFINGSDSETVLTRLSAKYPTLQNALSQINSKLDKADAQIKQSITTLFENGGLPATPFKTKALMTASSLPDGKYAIVTDDTVNNGLYVKTAGAWVKSAYDPIAESKVYTDTKYNSLLTLRADPANLFNASTVITGASLSAVDGTIITTNQQNNSLSDFIPITGGATYKKISAGQTAFFTANKVYISKVETTDNIIAPDNAAFARIVMSNGNVATQMFTLQSNSITVYKPYSASLYIKDLPATIPKLATELVPFLQNTGLADQAITTAKAYTDTLIIKGKNKFDGVLLQDVALQGPVGSNYASAIISSENALTAIIEIKPNTTYTISKTTSTRFRYGVAKSKPIVGGSIYIKILAGAENDSKLSSTFTSGAEDNYLILYLSNNNIAPSFTQLELGANQTEWEKYGYKFVSTAEPLVTSNNGGGSTTVVGLSSNAKFIERGNAEVYTDANKYVVAQDSTVALQAIFDAGGVIDLDGSQIYKISSSIIIDLTKVSAVNGNGATIITTTDVPVIKVVGNLSKGLTSQPNLHTAMSMLASGRTIKGLRLTSSSGLIGQAASISGTFMLDFDCECYFLRAGVVVENTNRNLRLRPKVYAVRQECLRFAPTCDLHQCQLYAGDMTYANKIIYFDDPTIYNMQVTGSDFEVNPFNPVGGGQVVPHSIIHMRSDVNVLDNIVFSGMTLEAHYFAQRIVKIEATSANKIRAINFSGCYFGNPAQNAFELSNVDGLKFEGTLRNFKGYAFKILGNVNNLQVSGQVLANNGTEAGGGLIHSVGSHTIKDVSLDVQLRGSAINSVVLECNVEGFICNDNIMRLSGNTNYDADKGFIHIDCTGKAVSGVKINDNVFYVGTTITDTVKVVGTPTGRIEVRGNDSDGGAYPIETSKILSSSNYAGA